MEVTRPLLLGLFYKVKWPITPNKSAGSVCSFSGLGQFLQSWSIKGGLISESLSLLLTSPKMGAESVP